MIEKDDIDLFRQAMRHVKPLKSTDKTYLKSHQAEDNLAYRRKQAQAITPTLTVGLSIKQKVAAHEVMHYAQTGLADSQYNRLKKGEISIQAELDLHGYTVEQGILALEDFFILSRERQYRCLRIIHGKGKQDNALIKNATLAFLQAQTDVLAFHSAPPKMGGTGVVLVLLKRYSP
ncbi:MAG: hypothetical protein HKM04_11210 [Legionellales bacterium]|nr:hypothetical protein [Legionellales bacterium]